MRFTEGEVAGLWRIDIEPAADHRGFFARWWSVDEFSSHGLIAEWPHGNLQFSPEAGTMRGLHYQVPPHSEVKLVHCTRGSVFDVAVDLRPYSVTYRTWTATELSADGHNAVWVPKGCAHGYLTLEPDTEVEYLASSRYQPASVRGVRYDDPAFGIEWPRPIALVPADYDTWAPYHDDRSAELAPLEEEAAG